MESYRDKLKRRQEQTVKDKDTRIAGRKSILDLTKIDLPPWTPKCGAKKEDINCIDIMPWRVSRSFYKDLRAHSGRPVGLDVGDIDYKLEVCRHGNVGPGNDQFLCLRESLGKNDIRCEEMFLEYKKRKDGDKTFDEKKAKALSPSWRDFYIVFDYDLPEDDPHKGFRLWEVSYANFEKYLLEELAAAEGGDGMIVFWDFEDGRSIEFKGSEDSFMGQKFMKFPTSIKFIPREPYSENILDQLPSLDAALIIPTAEDSRLAHYGLEDEGGGGEKEEKEEEKAPPAETGGRRRRFSGEDPPPPPPEKKEPDPPPSTGGRSRGRGTVTEPPTSPPEKKGDECPAGGKFGEDCGKLQACKDEACDVAVYEACMKRHQDLSNKEKETPPVTGTSGRSRRR